MIDNQDRPEAGQENANDDAERQGSNGGGEIEVPDDDSDRQSGRSDKPGQTTQVDQDGAIDGGESSQNAGI